MGLPKVSVVLVNFRGIDDTLNAIKSIQETNYPKEQLEIVVVDNASGDNSVEKLKNLNDQIILVESNENLGFAGGVNLGVKKSTGEVIGLLNNDAKCDVNWINTAVDTFLNDKDVASVASKVLTWDGSAVDFVDGSLTWYGMGYKREALKPTDEVIDFKREVLFGTGSAMFFKKNIFEQVGGFDDRFFMFYEDVDLGWRLNLLGYKIIYEPKSIAYHKHHASIDKFGKYHENFLLERNALMSVYKNYEAASLDRVLPAAMALTVRRSITRGELNPDLLNIKNSKQSDTDDVTIKKDALTGLLAIDSLVEHLPSLTESRNKIQASRKRSDGEMVALFRQALEPAYPWPRYLEGYQKLMDVFNIESSFGRERKRVLVVTGEPLSENLAGPAIRALEISKFLVQDFDVLLATTKGNTLKYETVSTISTRHRKLNLLVDWADIVIFQGLLISENPWLADTEKILIADVYDPFHLEILEQRKQQGINNRLRGSRDTTDALNRQLRRADYFICASERQRSLWLGQLAAEGRVNPYTYDASADLRRLIDVVPFGISAKKPEKKNDPIRKLFPQIKSDDIVALWAGGIYDWLDPQVIVRAVKKLNNPKLKLVFMGLKHPNPEVPIMSSVMQLKELVQELGLTNSSVFFVEDWVNYDDRAQFLLSSDIGVSAHLEHIETEFSFRTRLLDHFWTGLPTISTKGDALSEIIEKNKAGLAVEKGDIDGWVGALTQMITDENFRKNCSESASKLSENYTWNKVLEPLYKFIKTATPSPDRLLMPDLLGESRFANPYLASFPRLTRSNLITAADLLKDKGVKAFAKKVIKKIIGRS
ncbi:MAG: glycosyltransferase [Actinomycetota bacterium]|nr:glycosyltransferase [Actinomycetota bacterium]